MSSAQTEVRDGSYRAALETAVAAARDAGRILHAEFLRPGGPRGPQGKCPADHEAELVIRKRIADRFPAHGIYGEEAAREDRPARDDGAHVWAVDPNDGTSPFQRGWRGAAVSIGLLRAGTPVLGVVYAYAARAGRGDLLAWAEGEPFTRNGNQVRPAARVPPERATVLVTQDADGNPAANATLSAPARFRALPSVAYRLALVAAGEAVAGVSLRGPVDWDVAAGHALLRAAGCELYRLGGEPVRYESNGRGAVGDCVGGVPGFARELARRDWSPVLRWPKQSDEPYPLVRPSRDHIATDPQLLDRAGACLLGQIAGDNLGALVEFQKAAEIARRYPGGPRDLEDGGHWQLLAGQPTDDSELALMLARSIVKHGGYDREAAARAYAYWYASRPFDVGATTATALRPAVEAVRAHGAVADAAARAAHRGAHSQANGALMRVSPLGIFGHAMSDDALAELARADAALTHAHPVCRDANAVFCVALAAAVRGDRDPADVHARALDWARRNALDPAVLRALRQAERTAPEDFDTQQGWVLIALQNAFHQLLHAPDVEEGVARSVAAGGDTDTNAAIAGALLGAAYGAEAVPHRWVDRILTCRPIDATPGCRRPRPIPFWPVDCLLLAERLVCLGQAGR